MSEPISLSALFRVRARFRRSVHIAADYRASDTLSGYVVTPLCREVLQRLGHGLRPGSHDRAWSITGPYGAGKSACALFAARLLAYPHDQEAHKLLRAADGDLYDELCTCIPGLPEGAFVPVPIVGSREPLALVLLRGLSRAVSSLTFHAPAVRACIGELRSLCDSLERGQLVLPEVVLSAIEQVTVALRQGSTPLGVLIILDELGKLLEYAALNPSQSDIYLLQSLAELVARSDQPPVGLIVILHQAFERYAARLSPLQQREWAKVQGRFQDIPFLASTEEVLRLVGTAIEPTGQMNGLAEVIATEAARARELELAGGSIGRDGAVELLARCAPLHPTVALVLARLFRSHLAQNERSLFAFLSSGEPRGFQEYLRLAQWKGDGERPFYRLHDLYDYVLASMGSTLYAQAQGKRWAEIEEALDRLPPDCTSLHSRLVKAIGMLALLGDQRRLKASSEVLAYALADGQVTAEEVHRALGELCQWKIALYRRHKDAYGLWEGSDIDLDERFRQAIGQIDRTASLALLVERHAALQPYIAKRHLHETGTLRYFTPRVTALEDLPDALQKPLQPADGAIIFVLGSEGMAPEETAERVRLATRDLEGPRREMLFFAIPRDTTGLREALEEVMAWEWVERNTPELVGDRTARRELAGRRIDATERLNRLCSHCFGRAQSYRTAIWVWAGEVRHWQTAAELSAALSEACDRAYASAPRILNELVNRRSLSSAAAAARRTLIERMLTRGHEERLGIQGYPPELSMYRSVLEHTGLHHRAGERWEFGPAGEEDPSRIRPLWGAIESFLATTEGRPRPVSELFTLLREPPYGVRDGLLPILLTAATLCWWDEIALYEDGSFVPQPGIAEYERIIKGPEHFTLQRYPLGKARSWLLDRYSSLIPRLGTPGGQASVLSAIRPLLVFVRQLPEYTRSTASLSEPARAVREAIAAAREPQRLLFEMLPKALNMAPIGSEGDELAAQTFFVELRKALLELQHAYDGLLQRVQAQLLEALKLPADLAAAREEIARRAAPLAESVADLRLKAFAHRLADRRLPKKEWLESVAALVVHKPPRQWSDDDLLRFGLELTNLAGQFRRVEELLLAHQPEGEAAQPGRALRLGVTLGSGQEWREIIHVQPEEEKAVGEALNALNEALQRTGAPERVRLAALAEIVRRTLSGSHQDGAPSQ